MSNGCTYWMIYLPHVAPDTFLLFVEDPHENTSLRDYSLGRMHKLPSAPTVREMSSQTEYGKTRFQIDEIRRKEDISYWRSVTQRYNDEYILVLTQQSGTLAESPPTPNSIQRPKEKADGKRGL
jgi:hypothetical protein